MSSRMRMKNVVLGAGAMGTAAFYHLARRGEPVLLVEQFGLGHDRGSSHGAARITRHSYADPIYARLMPAAFAAWRTLEADAGEPLYIRSGGVSFSPADVPYVRDVASNLESIGIPHRRMSGLEWNGLHPTFGLPEDFDVVFEPDAGMMKAARAIATQTATALRLGSDAKMVERTPVLRIDLEGESPTLVTKDGRIEAERLIVTAGAWTGSLVPRLAERLQPTRQQVFYFRPIQEDPWAIGRFPVFIYKGPGDLDAFYGMPSALGYGVKVARHGGPAVDPNEVDRTVSNVDETIVRDFLHAFLPGLADAPIDRSEVCLYTMAPDDHFHVDTLAERPDVVVASPCSGHGFKFSCLIGSILADLALTGRTEHNIDAWRFSTGLPSD